MTIQVKRKKSKVKRSGVPHFCLLPFYFLLPVVRPGKMIRQVLGSLFRKAATTRYPFVKAQVPERFRGRIRFTPDKCVGCKACMRDCPAGAITIRQVPSSQLPVNSGRADRTTLLGTDDCQLPTGRKKFEAEFDSARCIYCSQCVDSCPRAALETTPEFELAQCDPTRLKVVFHAEEKRD
jgi:formate hydrogenlyase subunit 6/NADH:ubiquinone oxidoreductase subunit I